MSLIENGFVFLYEMSGSVVAKWIRASNLSGNIARLYNLNPLNQWIMDVRKKHSVLTLKPKAATLNV